MIRLKHLKSLPLQFSMKELNGNEKYFYLSEALSREDEVIKFIQIGDIIL